MQSPDQLFADLFSAIQLAGIFPDSKTFADALFSEEPEAILMKYRSEKDSIGFSLQTFVHEHFELPAQAAEPYLSNAQLPITQHLQKLWDILEKPADKASKKQSSLLGLPHPFIVPGGRFREIYYWDSYFTMLGLAASGQWGRIENMLQNFAYLLKRYGLIPNGNRSYYLSRSQPPFFSLMVKLLPTFEQQLDYLPALEQEYAFWMDNRLDNSTIGTYRRVVQLETNTLLNRYYDDYPTPRPESYREDIELVHLAEASDTTTMYQHIRAAAESGWDFSSRWFADGQNMANICTTNLLPVDLNCLLWHLEDSLADLYAHLGQQQQAQQLSVASQKRKEAILHYFWSPPQHFFFDYNFTTQTHSKVYSLAAVFPLFFGLATPHQAQHVAKILEQRFLAQGGLLTTLERTEQQWDAPNGWAPLQWMAYRGLLRYGFEVLANQVRDRWLALNERVYKQTGKMMEKYNVQDIDLLAGGGEYPTQDGFGWTNGVYLAMCPS